MSGIVFDNGYIQVLVRRRYEPKKMRLYGIRKMSPILFVITLLVIIVTPTTLQPSVATANDTTADIADNPFFHMTVTSNQSTSTVGDKTNVTLRAVLVTMPNEQGIGNWNHTLQAALDELNRRHPEMNIQLDYAEPYGEFRNSTLDRLSNGEPVDIISLDQIWLGEFAEKGLIRNLTADFEQWGRMDDLYEANLDGSVYNNSLYGLWLWTDVRGMWYWKDTLQEAGVDPESLKTWDGYVSAAVKLKDFFGDRITQGVHLIGAPHARDLWYPYLWMLGGEILELREGHPTKGVYWFPSYNSSQGVGAMEFLKRQVDAGIIPQKEHSWGLEFANRTFPVMIEGSWLISSFPRESWPTLEQEVGFIPMFPVPNGTTQTSTMMGGWELAIPSTSQHGDLAWELITIMAEPQILGPFLQQFGFLPTQQTLGEGPSSQSLKESIPFFDEMVSMIPYGRGRPTAAEYPLIAEDIHEAIQQVYNGSAASPREALDMAAAKSAASLGWK
jgi:multiple sugar transport system substrate-binding protein